MERTRKKKGAAFGVATNDEDTQQVAQEATSVDLSDILEQAQKLAAADKVRKVERTMRFCTQCGSSEDNIHECGGDKDEYGNWDDDWVAENVETRVVDEYGNAVLDENGDYIVR
jgi:hypothetical protein